MYSHWVPPIQVPLVSVVSVLLALARRALKFGYLLLLARSPALLSILTGDFSYPFNAETPHSGRVATFPKPRHYFDKLQLLHIKYPKLFRFICQEGNRPGSGQST